MVTGQATLSNPLGRARRWANRSLPSRNARSARLQVCRYSLPKSVKESPRGLRCASITLRCCSSRVSDRLTVEVGSFSSFAAAVRVPAWAIMTKVRTSLRSGIATHDSSAKQPDGTARLVESNTVLRQRNTGLPPSVLRGGTRGASSISEQREEFEEDTMKVLVTGGTGNVGGAVVSELLKRGAEVRVLARKQPESGKLPAGVEVAIGDLLDPVSIEKAMQGVDKLFLLNAVVADELTQALIAYGIAKRIGLKHVTYLSVFKVEQFRDVPHFASKLAVESALREFAVPHTILRPGYYMQNDAGLKDALTGPGVYPMPIGTAGICAVDVRDIAEAAAISLAEDGHDGQTYDLVGPSTLTGPGNAAIWSKLLGKEIKYTGHNFDQWEQP